MTPTFRNSSRSTRGMTRITAYSNNSFSRTLRLLDKNPRRGESRLQKFDINLSPAVCGFKPRLACQPFVGNQRNNRLYGFGVEELAKLCARRFDLGGLRQQHVVFDLRERSATLLLPVLPGVMKVERRAVVNQP